MIDINSIENHPAVIAWKNVDSQAQIPQSIDTLKNSNSKCVLRFNGIGPNDWTIIAKRAETHRIQVEEMIYKKILPECSFKSIQCYGSIESEEKEFSWIFMADVQEQGFSYSIAEHKLEVMRWMGKLHSSTLTEKKISLLPDLSLNYFFDLLKKSRTRILENLSNPNLTESDSSHLKEIVIKLNKIESKWEDIKNHCNVIPPTLIHGDISAYNMKFYDKNSKFTLIPFDWETAGWGTAIFDFGSGFIYNKFEDEFSVYCSSLRQHSVNVSLQDIPYLVNIGRLLKLILYIYRESIYLHADWVSKIMKRMPYYQTAFLKIFTKVGWTEVRNS